MTSWHKSFKHIYIEKDILDHPRTQKILAHFKDSTVIIIDDYKEIFNRPRQNSVIQHHSQALILARKKDGFYYQGSPVCQSFDERYFYYTSSIMNCPYNCEYCFLKGMYSGGHIVVFVNIEDIFASIKETLSKHPMYICVSYDADMLALERILSYGKLWSEFTQSEPNLTIEIRTKGTGYDFFKDIKASERVILAVTVSPEEVIKSFEHQTPTLKQRITLINKAMANGWPVRLCFDPIVYIPKWVLAYQELLKQLDDSITWNKLKDVSVGSFRISKDYLPSMRRQLPNSAILQYPYECLDGFHQLPLSVKQDIEGYMYQEVSKRIDERKIFLWQ